MQFLNQIIDLKIQILYTHFMTLFIALGYCSYSNWSHCLLF